MSDDDQEQLRRSVVNLARGRRSPVTMTTDAHRRRLVALLRGNRMLFGGKVADAAHHAVCCAILHNNRVIGSGVAIGAQTVLTAAHVVTARDVTQPEGWRAIDHETLRVYAGRPAQADTRVAVAVTAPVRVHKGYDPRRADVRSHGAIASTTPKYDAALIRVSPPLDTHVTAMSSVQPTSIVETLGFGSTRQEHAANDDVGVRHYAQFTIGPAEPPRRASEFGYCPPLEFLLGERDAETPSPDTRRGDSGGPVLDEATRSLIGITCRGVVSYDGRVRNCGVYLAIDAIRDWLASNDGSMERL